MQHYSCNQQANARPIYISLTVTKHNYICTTIYSFIYCVAAYSGYCIATVYKGPCAHTYTCICVQLRRVSMMSKDIDSCYSEFSIGLLSVIGVSTYNCLAVANIAINITHQECANDFTEMLFFMFDLCYTLCMN